MPKSVEPICHEESQDEIIQMPPKPHPHLNVAPVPISAMACGWPSSGLESAVEIRHFWVGIAKVPVLAAAIAITGCRHGLAVKGDVEQLGSRVTVAVVQALFAIIFLDAAFAVLFNVFGI